MRVLVYRLSDFNKAKKLELTIDETLEVSLKFFKLIYEGEVPENTSIDEIENYIHKSKIGDIGDVVRLEKRWFFCASHAWLRVNVRDIDETWESDPSV